MSTNQDEIEVLWQHIDRLQQPGALRSQLGEALCRLRSLYSERERKSGRQSADVQGHGTFEREVIRRGWKPRTVRTLISDYEVEWARITGHAKPGSKTSAEKRQESRARQRARLRPRNRRSSDIPGFRDHADEFTKFARLLPYRAAKAAFRQAAKCFHPDLGGNGANMTTLNLLWEKLEPLYRASDSVLPIDTHDIAQQNIQ